MMFALALSIVALISVAVLSWQFWMGDLLGGCGCNICAHRRYRLRVMR